MQALGLIETRGLLPAIECLDIMLKSAQVELIEKCNVGGGLVTIAVTGDVGAVQASVEAGASAAQQLGSDVLISRHVIPRPHNDIASIIGRRSVSNIAKEKDELAMQVQHTQAAEQMPEQTPEPDTVSDVPMEAASDVPLDAAPNVSINTGSEEGFPVLAADPDQDLAAEDASPEMDNGDPAKLDSPFKHQIDVLVKESGLDKAMELLETMTVVKLRGLARECSPAYGMSMTTISKANKVKLLKRFRQYYQQ
ncbi:Carboxysome shell and ethanolamine utilization microcompartment protein CcmL/EutN [Paenibacillus uliginis N3/975]|uniref:Carboxysome shell and ethanolamine utilization microcompartment protein CcmL/EutN n=1 Tax=Paenibacillus uliginis N3/975 TaxID=1313296 RepID=A0A1X7HEM7_9BACL|nr:BMC domain-containing protein [Paenibacillus uliginis]SMF85137.1 Carboxysome shell and ethanolamine utilization microcompartment protein CcmL/EutN [Paenibacillus uliginis N3/975]